MEPDCADAFIEPVHVAVLLLIGHGVWKLTEPKLSTLPCASPSLLDTSPFLMMSYRGSVRDVWPDGLGYLKKKLYAPSNFDTLLAASNGFATAHAVSIASETATIAGPVACLGI